MEDCEAKICPNCKREIPSVNFTTHSVHCARNIRMCPVCKEPVPQAELQDHHDKLHKLVPCKKCGESVCGTDLEDHVRDSCALTIRSCRFCELELPRREIPAHEGYCGVRTEQCPECREWVMIKYRQLHVDSNHGFIRLDDDPAPIPKKEPLKTTNLNKPLVTKITNLPSTSNGVTRPVTSKLDNTSQTNGFTRNINRNDMPRTEMRYVGEGSSEASSSNTVSPNVVESTSAWRPPSSSQTNGTRAPLKRTNDQPQINTNVAAPNKVEKNLSMSRGAVKKRPAPLPPVADSRRDLPYYSAIQRQQGEEQERQQQTAYNLAMGLPPVLSAAAKLEKLRKMDALQNLEAPVDYKNRLQGRVWRSPEQDSAGRVVRTHDNDENERRRQEFKNLKPMTPQQFMERFNQMQLRRDEAANARSGDRFSEIKSSLRELRRDLNEVTAPYNLNSNAVPSGYNRERPRSSPRTSPIPMSDEGEVRLPCEFCDALVPAQDLVQHQTGCRPDLAQFRPITGAGEEVEARAEAVAESAAGDREPVIPCEFCAESLPVYLISEHQERCGRDASLLYPD